MSQSWAYSFQPCFEDLLFVSRMENRMYVMPVKLLGVFSASFASTNVSNFCYDDQVKKGAIHRWTRACYVQAKSKITKKAKDPVARVSRTDQSSSSFLLLSFLLSVISVVGSCASACIRSRSTY